MVITAPAGAGKSTVAAQLLRMDPRPHAFVSLTTSSDAPVALADVLLDAFEQIGSPVPATRASVTALEPGFSGVLLPALTRLAASRTSPYLVVIDDLHQVNDVQCQQMVAAVAAGVPVGSLLVLCTRRETPDWLARARTEGRLLELDAGDLAFTVDEAAQLFRRLGADLPERAVASVVDRCEGWAVGVYLTALAVEREGSWAVGIDVPAPTATSAIQDYLHVEVLGAMSSTERLFLTRTSVLDDLEPSLCNAVLERTDSTRILRRLQRSTKLVSASDDGSGYRCHHLLREALLTALSVEAPEFEPVAHLRAARWYADQGDLDSAIRHATASGDRSAIATLVWSGVLTSVGTGQPERLVHWLSGLSEQQIAANPWLSLAAAWGAVATGDMDGMTRWLLRSHDHAGRGWRARVSTQEYAASVAVLEAVVGTGGLTDVAELTANAMEGLPAGSGFRAAAAWLRGMALTLLRQPDEADRWLAEATQLARALDVPMVQADAASWQGIVAVLLGQPSRAGQFLDGVARLVEANHLDRLAYSAHTLTALAVMQAVAHSPDTKDTLATALRLSATVPQIAPWFGVCGRLAQAHVAIRLGDGALARVLVNDARHAMTPDLAGSLAGDLLTLAHESLQAMTRDGVSGAALTTAEMRVLQFLPSHLTLPAIGEHLFLSRNTVKSHAMAIYRKLGVDSRASAVEVAQSLGLVSVPPSE